MSVHFFRYLQPRLLFADGGGLRELRRVAVRRVGAAANCAIASRWRNVVEFLHSIPLFFPPKMPIFGLTLDTSPRQSRKRIRFCARLTRIFDIKPNRHETRQEYYPPRFYPHRRRCDHGNSVARHESVGRARRQKKLWKGFNLLNKFNPDYQTPFAESDFEIMAEWGFNFARIPLSYWCWSSEDDWYRADEKF